VRRGLRGSERTRTHTHTRTPTHTKSCTHAHTQWARTVCERMCTGGFYKPGAPGSSSPGAAVGARGVAVSTSLWEHKRTKGMAFESQEEAKYKQHKPHNIHIQHDTPSNILHKKTHHTPHQQCTTQRPALPPTPEQMTQDTRHRQQHTAQRNGERTAQRHTIPKASNQALHEFT